MTGDDIHFKKANDNCHPSIADPLLHAKKLWVSLQDAVSMLSDAQLKEFDEFTDREIDGL